jgi:hypothetical protein
MIAASDAMIAASDAMIAASDAMIAASDAMIAASDAMIAASDAMITGHEAMIASSIAGHARRGPISASATSRPRPQRRPPPHQEATPPPTRAGSNVRHSAPACECMVQAHSVGTAALDVFGVAPLALTLLARCDPSSAEPFFSAEVPSSGSAVPSRFESRRLATAEARFEPSATAAARLDREGQWVSSGPASSEQEARLDREGR